MSNRATHLKQGTSWGSILKIPDLVRYAVEWHTHTHFKVFSIFFRPKAHNSKVSPASQPTQPETPCSSVILGPIAESAKRNDPLPDITFPTGLCLPTVISSQQLYCLAVPAFCTLFWPSLYHFHSSRFLLLPPECISLSGAQNSSEFQTLSTGVVILYPAAFPVPQRWTILAWGRGVIVWRKKKGEHCTCNNTWEFVVGKKSVRSCIDTAFYCSMSCPIIRIRTRQDWEYRLESRLAK